MDQILIATKNAGKAKEFSDFFSTYKIKTLTLADLHEPIPDIAETGSTFEENAAIKAEEIAAIVQSPVLADDSGLAIDVLDGRPGIFSARYAGASKNDHANINKVLHELAGVPLSKRSARFVCVLAVAIPGERTIFREGFCEGSIALAPKGGNGFGYDPIFIPDGYSITMAEMDPAEKNKISHRKNAMNRLEDFINEKFRL